MRQRRAGEQRLQRGQQQHAADHAEIVPAPAGDQRAADHHHGDRRQQILVAHAEARLAVEAGEQDADQRGAQAAQHIGADQGLADIDAGQVGDPGAVANRVDPPAEGGAAEQHRAADDEQQQHPDHRRGVEEAAGHQPAQRRRREAGRGAVAVDQREALDDAVGSERDDDRRQPEQHDAGAVGQPDKRADRQYRRYRPEGRQVEAVGGAGEQDAAEHNGPGQRQVEAAGQDDRALAERQDGEEAAEDEQRIEVVEVEPAIVDQGHGEHEDQRDIGRQRIAQRLAVAHQPSRQARRPAARPPQHDARRPGWQPAGQRAVAPRLPALAGDAQIGGDRRVAVERGAEHGQDQDDALGDRAVVGGDVEHQQDVDDDHQDVGADHRAEAAAAPAAERRAADHDGREHFEQQRRADQRIG